MSVFSFNKIVLFEVILLIGFVHGDCNSPLGLQSEDIPNSDITASSEWAANHGPSNARLNRPASGGRTGAWSARANNMGQWIQANLRQLTRVTKVAIQGRQDHPQWVTAFKISYSLNGKHFEYQQKIYYGNNDRNSIVFNILMAPIEARFVRLHPYAWHGHISLRMEFYGCSLKPECAHPLGLENYRIPDSAFASSSEWDSNHGPTNARLNRPSGGGKTGAWSAKRNDRNQWIQVTFPEVTKIYNGNSNRNSIVVNDLGAPIQARVVRINPVEWYGHISLRMELYGCRSSSECATPLGMENRVIPNYAITASSEWAANHGASNARLHRPAGGGRTGAWSAKTNDKSQWIQVDLRGKFKVTKILTQGRHDYAQWVTQYKVSYSSDGVHFSDQNKVYQANKDQNTVVVNTLEYPIEARFIRLNPKQWFGHISLRMELYGCSLNSECMSPMGMENKFLPNYAITASSEWASNHGASNARLYHIAGGGRTGAWSARTNDKSQWIQVDLGTVKRVTQIASQGRSDYAQWVTRYRVSYSSFGKVFHIQDHVYQANSDQHSVVVNTLVKPIEARFFRIKVEGWHGHISMRFELYGCHVHSACVSPLGLTSKKLPNSALTASSEWAGNHGASNARLYHVSGGGRTGAWSAKFNNKGQWLEVDLGETTKVTMVVTQGRYDYDQWVYQANGDRNGVILNRLIQPIEARFVRIYPETWHGHISMRVELHGCEIRSGCNLPLGMENYHIPDSAIAASSWWDPNHGPNNARIYHMAGGGRRGAWSAKTNDKGQWIQVNLRKAMKVTKIGMQGRQDYAQWVTKYRVAYSTDGQHFSVQNQKFSGNRDQNTLVITDVAQSIKAQYIRILPQEWHGHISLRMELYGCDISGAIDGGYSEWEDWGECSVSCGRGSRSRRRSCNNPVPQNGGSDCSSLGPMEEFESCNMQPCRDCDTPLGIQSGDIPNSDITSSSEWDANHGPSNARINRPAGGGKTGAWSARANDMKQWIQVNLRQLTRVTKVAIQGRQDHPQWVTAFKISYSLDGKHFKYQEKIYNGNNDQNSVVVNTLVEPIVARFIRLHPYVWHRHISLRMELYGCTLGQECKSPLGMENYRIPNSAITASSEWDANHGPTNARLNRPSGSGKTGAWSAKRNDANQWIQVTFSEVTKVTGVGIQGRYDYNQWVTKFKVSYSRDGIHFVILSKIYQGNNNRNGIVLNDLGTSIIARVVRINPVEWYGHISLRMELYGCRLPSECSRPLGMENQLIPDYAITASTEWAANHGASNARLHRPAGGGRTGAWSAKRNDKSQWIQVDLRERYKVTKVLTQGRQDYAQWVTQFKVSYSVDGTNFIFQNKVYQANSNQNTVVVNALEKPIQAHFIRLHPQKWYGHISLRMELYGCSLQADCTSPMGMENKMLPDYAITASSEWAANHGASNARLYFMAGGGRTGAWSARTNAKSQWIQVDFEKMKRVTQIASQGRSDYAQWVTRYRVSYSTFGKTFKSHDHVYSANSDQHSVVVNTLVKPTEARFFRINVEGWHGHISMRFELYGCDVFEACVSPLGLTNKKLPNSALTASSEWDRNHGPSNARLYRVSGGGRSGAWSAKLNNKGQWLEADLGETTAVAMVATQGRYDYDQWVKSFKVAYSKYGSHFEFQNKVYDANTDRNSVIVNELIRPIKARFVRIYPVSWHGHMSMRMEFYGCEIHTECSLPLGLENNYLPDSAITASSMWDANHGPNNARIYRMAGGGRTGAWSAKTNDKGQWIQVNLGKITTVTKIGIQGRQDYAQWVTSYKVSYSQDGQHFAIQNQEYVGSKDQNTLVINDLIKSIKAQYVRILPQGWHGHISMRIELYGCVSIIDGGFTEWTV
ncbi:hypothetical protein pdam_00013777, partial [Pocillopora damicornis]